MENANIVIIGAGQAGLSLSHELRHAEIDHIVFERARVAQAWRTRWDSFCLVIPNWTVRLPGKNYGGTDPDGFMSKDAIAAHLVDYARSFEAPVRENVNVSAVESSEDGGFELHTSSGKIRAREVVIASGGFQKPHRHPAWAQLPPTLEAIDAQDYTNPRALPAGPVLIVGSGQTGCQLAEELFESGRETYLACGRAAWVPRKFEGVDAIRWMVKTPFFDGTVADLPSPLARFGANPQMSGGSGGHDLHFRTLQAMGVTLLGHFIGCDGSIAHFAADLNESVAFGDSRYADICALIAKSCSELGIKPPEMPSPPRFNANPPERLNLAKFGSVIFTSGFRPDYTSWLKFPSAFDEMGFPIQEDGSSTIVPGLHFMGVIFQRRRKSSNFLGVAEDAAVLASRIANASKRNAVAR